MGQGSLVIILTNTSLLTGQWSVRDMEEPAGMYNPGLYCWSLIMVIASTAGLTVTMILVLSMVHISVLPLMVEPVTSVMVVWCIIWTTLVPTTSSLLLIS